MSACSLGALERRCALIGIIALSWLRVVGYGVRVMENEEVQAVGERWWNYWISGVVPLPIYSLLLGGGWSLLRLWVWLMGVFSLFSSGMCLGRERSTELNL